MLVAGGPSNLGLGGATVCCSVRSELGNRGLFRSRSAGRVVCSRVGRRYDAGESTELRNSACPTAGEPLLPEFPPFPKSALATYRVDTRCYHRANTTAGRNRSSWTRSQQRSFDRSR